MFMIELGTPGFTSYSKKFTKVDYEKHLKETEVIEGGYLDMGFTLYRIRFEIFEKRNDSCIIKATIEYDVKEEVAVNASYATIEPLVTIIELTKNYLIKSKAAKDAN
jgi:ribosome-associated toxin RatA of RatAB toxin-antitoxin module